MHNGTENFATLHQRLAMRSHLLARAANMSLHLKWRAIKASLKEEKTKPSAAS